eukprot:gene11620-24325_t
MSFFKLPILSFLVVIFFAIGSHGFQTTGFTRHQIKSAARKNSFSLLAKAVYKVTIQHEGVDTILDVREDVTVLEAALDAGIELPHDCKLGVCLTCPSRVVSGTIDQSTGSLDLTVAEKGFALTCVAYPKSDCVIRSIEEEELVGAQFSDSRSCSCPRGIKKLRKKTCVIQPISERNRLKRVRTRTVESQDSTHFPTTLVPSFFVGDSKSGIRNPSARTYQRAL